MSVSMAVVQVDLTMIMGAFIGMLVLCVGVSIAYRPPMRTCLGCGEEVPLTRRRCRQCGYEFE